MKLSPAQMKAMQYFAVKKYFTVQYQKFDGRYRFEVVSVRTVRALVRLGLVVIYAPHGTWSKAWLTEAGKEFLKGLK